MSKLFSTIYFVVISGVLFRAFSYGAEWPAYYDFTSLSLVLIPSFLIYLISKSIKFALISAWLGALLGLILGLYLTFSNFVEMQAAFGGISVSMLPMLYAAVISLYFYPLHLLREK
ncbi:hypothetical protein [Vibrio jasicida]|uniref:hypothetical protein n=1 Tax=Vibrio jasicida TaxID=766224 RepID=UPI0006964D2F|nr:hypothetical protein [Vibrio jasicida]